MRRRAQSQSSNARSVIRRLESIIVAPLDIDVTARRFHAGCCPLCNIDAIVCVLTYMPRSPGCQKGICQAPLSRARCGRELPFRSELAA